MKKTLVSKSIVLSGFVALFAIAGCQNNSMVTREMAGTMDEPVPSDTVPEKVRLAMDKADRYHSHELMSDPENEIEVLAIDALTCSDSPEETSTEGYGITVSKKATSVTFPYIRHDRQPEAKYNGRTGDLWLTSAAIAGTGVRVEWLYLIRFGEDDMAFVKTQVNPYGVQQELLKRLSYTIEGENITLYDGEKQLATVTNTVKDMGGFDEAQPLWIGEQIFYDVSSAEPKVVFVPGVKFTTGLVLHYDDMPELMAPITIDENGMFTIHEISRREI